MNGHCYTENAVPALCGKIVDFFNAGFDIGRDVSHQLCSMFGPDAENHPERLFEDPHCADVETLFDLICFPDIDFQASIEPLLVSSFMTPVQVTELAGMIQEKKPVTRLFFLAADPAAHPEEKGSMPAGGQPDHKPGKYFSVPVPSGVIDRFIRRLNILRKIETAVGQAVAARFKYPSPTSDHASRIRTGIGDAALRCRVILRNGRFSFTPETIPFLCAVFERLDGDDQAFADALYVAVDFLEQATGSKGLREGFVRHRAHLHKMLEVAARADKLVKKGPVEAFMLNRTPIPSVNVRATRQRLVVMDRIGLAVYGNTYFRDIEFDSMPLTVLEIPLENG